MSDKYAGQRDALIDVPSGGSFADLVALKGKADIGDKINKIIVNLAGKKKLKNATDVADFTDATDFNDAITSARARRRLTGCLTSARVSRTHRSLQLSLHFCVRW